MGRHHGQLRRSTGAILNRQLRTPSTGVDTRTVQDARPVLRDLLDGHPIRFTSIEEAEMRGYRFDGRVQIGGILSEIVRVVSVASPGGLEPPAYRLGGGRSIH